MRQRCFRIFVEFSLNHQTDIHHRGEAAVVPPYTSPCSSFSFRTPASPRSRGSRGRPRPGQAEEGAAPALPVPGPLPPLGTARPGRRPRPSPGGPAGVRAQSRPDPRPPPARGQTPAGPPGRPSLAPHPGADALRPRAVAVLTGARRVTGSAMGTDRTGGRCRRFAQTAPLPDKPTAAPPRCRGSL